MKTTATLKRAKRIRPANAKRRRINYARNFGDEAEAVRRMPCLACGAHAEPCHVTARGMGSAKGGRFDLVPLCRTHHQEAGEAGTSQRETFEREHGLDLRANADGIAMQHDPPLGLRGVARAWMVSAEQLAAGAAAQVAATMAASRRDWPTCALTQANATVLLSAGAGSMPSNYERHALLGWVARTASGSDVNGTVGYFAWALNVTEEQAAGLIRLATGGQNDGE